MKNMKRLIEMHEPDDNYSRAIDMINAAVEYHNLNDDFGKIADIEGLVSFLQGRYHDFNPAIEQSVRDIIADEMGHEEEEEYRSGTEDSSWVAARPINPQDPISRNKPNRSQPKQRHKDAGYQYGDGSATWEEEEDSSGYRGKLKSASRIISAKGNEEDWRPQDTSWEDAEEEKQRRRDEERRAREENEEFRGGGKYNRAPQGPEFRGGGKQKDRFRLRPRGRNLRDRLQARRRQTHSREPFSVEQEERNTNVVYDDVTGMNQEWDRKTGKLSREWRGDEGRVGRDRARRGQTIGGRAAIALARRRGRSKLEQEEVDWNKEVSRFRKRRKTYEPKFARRPSRLRKRSNSSDSSVFSMRFGQFNEMYRDSQHGLTIDLSGPEGNAFALMGHAQQLAKELGKDPEAIVNDMMHSDYDHLLDVFDREFGSIITLLNRPGEDMARMRDQEQSDRREPGSDGNMKTPPRGGSNN